MDQAPVHKNDMVCIRCCIQMLHFPGFWMDTKCQYGLRFSDQQKPAAIFFLVKKSHFHDKQIARIYYITAAKIPIHFDQSTNIMKKSRKYTVFRCRRGDAIFVSVSLSEVQLCPDQTIQFVWQNILYYKIAEIIAILWDIKMWICVCNNGFVHCNDASPPSSSPRPPHLQEIHEWKQSMKQANTEWW